MSKPTLEGSASRVMNCLWPIANNELKRFIPMALMMMCVLFNYNMLRVIKDSLIVPNIGAEALSIVKLYCVVPAAIVTMLTYAKMANIFKQQTIFYIMTCIFIVFFLTFALFLYPYQDILHPDRESLAFLATQTVDIAGFSCPLSHFKWFFLVYSKWTYVLFYIFAELWGSIMLSLLFWQFANQFTKTEEAKRFYPMYGFIGNIGLIIAGSFLKKIALKASELQDPSFLIYSTTAALIVSAILIIILYSYMHLKVYNKAMASEAAYIKERSQVSLKQSLKIIFSSKYLGLVAILLFSYGITINLIEGPWKARVAELYPDTTRYAHFMGTMTTYTGIASMVAMIIGANILSKVTWFSGAMLTPVVLFVSGLGFFIFVVFNDTIIKHFDVLQVFDPLWIAVMFGMIQNILSKATKYSFFDPTKEMSYIPISRELQTQGKAAVDIVGARAAKSFGAFFQSSLFIIFPMATYAVVTPYLMGLFVVVAIIWMLDVKFLYREYSKRINGKKNHSPK